MIYAIYSIVLYIMLTLEEIYRPYAALTDRSVDHRCMLERERERERGQQCTSARTQGRKRGGDLCCLKNIENWMMTWDDRKKRNSARGRRTEAVQ